MGAYTRLLNFEWMTGPLPADMQRLASVCRVRRQRFERLWKSLRPLFQSDGNGHYFQGRLERERRRAEALVDKKKKAAKARWDKENGHARALQVDMQTACNLDPELDSEQELPLTTSEEKPIIVAPSGADRVRSQQIEEVWSFFLRRRVAYLTTKNGKAPPRPPDLTPARRKIIAQAIRLHGYEKARYAGGGIFLDPFYAGENDRQTEYLSPEHVWRIKGDRDNVEKFADRYLEALDREGMLDE